MVKNKCIEVPNNSTHTQKNAQGGKKVVLSRENKSKWMAKLPILQEIYLGVGGKEKTKSVSSHENIRKDK